MDFFLRLSCRKHKRVHVGLTPNLHSTLEQIIYSATMAEGIHIDGGGVSEFFISASERISSIDTLAASAGVMVVSEDLSANHLPERLTHSGQYVVPALKGFE